LSLPNGLAYFAIAGDKEKRFYKIDAGSSEGMTEMIELEKK